MLPHIGRLDIERKTTIFALWIIIVLRPCGVSTRKGHQAEKKKTIESSIKTRMKPGKGISFIQLS
jgi:hypothetical protein